MSASHHRITRLRMVRSSPTASTISGKAAPRRAAGHHDWRRSARRAEAHAAGAIGETGPATQDGQDLAEIELTVAISGLIRKGNMAQQSLSSYVAGQTRRFPEIGNRRFQAKMSRKSGRLRPLFPRSRSDRLWRTIGGDLNDRNGEGFRTPARNTTGRTAAGPAFESLPWRKPRAGRGSVWASASYGDLKVGSRARVSLRGLEAGDFVSLDQVSGLGWRRRHEDTA